MNDTDATRPPETLEGLRAALAEAGLELPVREDLSPLLTGVSFGRREAPNRLLAQPMEGCDAAPGGGPGPLTVRKYRRFAAGGWGTIWFEAVAVVESGRANPRQLWIRPGNVAAFAEMLQEVRRTCREVHGFEPVCVVQLTHSGRYSRPNGRPEPVLARHCAELDEAGGIDADLPLISDAQLEALQQDFVNAATLAAEAGFDAIDLKCCHGYLLHGLLAAYGRPGRFGGDYGGRTRMLRETVERVGEAVGDRIDLTCRLNVYDRVPYPDGWGMAADGSLAEDLTEPQRLVDELEAMSLAALNVTAGNPYYNPFVNRPYRRDVPGRPAPPEPPLAGTVRILRQAGEIQRAHPRLPVAASGLSWPGALAGHVAAGLLEAGWAQLAGFGRGALAYPDLPADVMRGGDLDPKKVCLTCSACTRIMRQGGTSGCPVRDAEVYAPVLRGERAAMDV
jgi:2,4-dienoyl-CoA reductase-like NADH-dependent reductase (Old Yellow Enzyme family)